eukprot:1954371-Alexandrium_andersonii.AAC.1
MSSNIDGEWPGSKICKGPGLPPRDSLIELFSPPRVGPVAAEVFKLPRCSFAVDKKTGFDLSCEDTLRHILGTAWVV